jgi:hypothetical protein
MIELIEAGLDEKVLAMRISGSIERRDLDLVAAALEEKLLGRTRVRIYVEIQELEGISPQALLEDLRLSLRHFRQVEREAIVTGATWLKLLARLGGLIPGIEVRQFSWIEKDEALQWING